jgi:hypothetical protein
MMVELVAIAVAAILLLVVINWSQGKTSGLNHQYYQTKWHDIKTLEHTSAAAARLAVMEADKLLDHALKDVRVRGETMGDRLKNAAKLLGSANNTVWAAHKLRNKLAHEDIHPKPAEIRRALGAFEAGLKKLRAL